MRRVLLYGALGGVLIAALKLLEYRHFVHAYPGETYGGLVAILFTALGVHVGLRWHRRREVVVVREVMMPAPPPEASAGAQPFAADAERLRAIGLTAREGEILALIAEGLSNREIGERLFISENTVKTHSSRVFAKLGVARRVQAVQRARALGLVP